MINLKLFILKDKQLHKAKKSNFYSTIVFNKLFLIILIRDFYKFALILGKTLRNHLISQKR